MPLTFPAHQSVVLPLKLRFPSRIDGLALLVGAGAPDLMYGVGVTWLFAHGLRSLPILVPAVVVYCMALRRWALPGLFRFAPTIMGADLRAYGAMSTGRPSLIKTTVSAAVGVASHQAWDALSHAKHPVASAIGFDQSLFTLTVGPLTRDFTIAKAIQYSGHMLGSLVTLVLLYLVVRWRSEGVLNWDEADQLMATTRPRATWVLAVIGVVTLLAVGLWPLVQARGPFVLIVWWAIAMVFMGWFVERDYRRDSSSANPKHPAR